VQAGSIKKGDFCMLKGFPCLITDSATAKTNKGGVKTTITGTDIFTNKKHEESCPASATVQVPTVQRTDYEVADIDEDGFVSVLLQDGNLKDNLKLPEDDE
jgi:translation initiation factor 5A